MTSEVQVKIIYRDKCYTYDPSSCSFTPPWRLSMDFRNRFLTRNSILKFLSNRSEIFGQISKRKIFHFFHFCHLIRTFFYLAKMPCCCSAYVNKQRQSISNFDRDQNRGKLLWWKLAFEACLGLLRYQISPERILCTGQIVNKEDTSFCRSTKIFHSLNWRLRDLMYLPMLA